jgi:hypothetical protein
MKKKIILLIILSGLTGSTFLHAQKKGSSKKEVATDTAKAVTSPKSAAQDSLKALHVNDSLKTLKANDSLNAQLTLYKGFYTYISGKFFPEKYKNIPIEKAIPLADSLRAARDEKFKGLETMSKGRMDSIALLLKTAEALRIENQTFKTLLASLIGEKVYPQQEAELKGSWQVFVNPIKLSGTGQMSAVVSLEKMILVDSIAKASISQIVFLEEDLADIYFLGGKKTKCFYKVTGFSRDKTYSIALEKSNEINITLFITPVPRGLQISYKLGKNPNYYMFGYMRR